MIDNFIDCGTNNDIKAESDEDIPLSELHDNGLSDNESEIQHYKLNKEPEIKNKRKLKKESEFKKKSNLKKEFFISSEKMSEDELKEVLLSKKKSEEFIGSNFKCDSCVVVFQNEGGLAEHNLSFHTEVNIRLMSVIILNSFDKSNMYRNIET